jgi:hypothetical protein
LDGKTIGRGYFKKAGIENLIAADLASGGHSKELFSLAVLELWHRAFLDNPLAVSVHNPSQESFAETK